MEKIFDLPAHPLFVHFPVVLTPLLALGALLLAVRPRWQRNGAPWLFAASVITLVATLMARASGEKMYDLLKQEPSIGRHKELANQTTLLLLVFVVCTGAFFAVVQRANTQSSHSPSLRRITTVLSAIVVVVGAAVSVWMARAGHEGAKSHWNFVNT